MAKQKHDIGYQKRHKRENAAPRSAPASTEGMAHSLVKRGLCSQQILDYPPKRHGGRR